MQKIIKCKLVDTTEDKFDLIEAILEGDALIHWLTFKWVEVVRTSKNPDGLDMAPLGMCNPIFAVCLQELKKHYFQKNLACLQKAYIYNHIKKLNKLSTKNTVARLHDVNGMLATFQVPGNNLMSDDKFCNILYQMVKHDWCDALRKL
eukprot:13710907-Ditylum_brightwellii.AAC.1